LAATGSVALTELVSAACGKELAAAGINWAFSPVADVNSEPKNPVIGERHTLERRTTVSHIPSRREVLWRW
jgi:beta-N-acetylhexosaminidase